MPTSAELFQLLRRRGLRDGKGLDAAIEAGGRRELAILMADSSGSTRRAREFGILQFLAVMTHCYDHLIPMFKNRGGVTVDNKADNILAVFDRPGQAIRAAVDAQRWLARHNKGRAERERFHACIGLHYGKVLRVKDGVFGENVNIAAKVGEDLADKDDILATREIRDLAPRAAPLAYARTTPIGGRMVELFRVRWSCTGSRWG